MKSLRASAIASHFSTVCCIIHVVSIIVVIPTPLPGGMVCRGILEHFSVPVKTFISLASPQAGQFGGEELDLLLSTTR